VLRAAHSASGKVTLAIRPERAQLVAAGSGALQTRLMHTAYLGTAPLHKLLLTDGSTFLLRQSDRSKHTPETGGMVGLDLPKDAQRVLTQ
jgi:spermidine/putrescine transport system ATP-binding protein